MTQRIPLVEVAGQPQQLQAGDSIYGNIPFGRRNAIINGNFDVWQRGTTFTSPAANLYNVDRWFYAYTSTSVVTISQSTDVPTGGILSNFSMKIACTTSQSSPSSGQFAFLTQAIEGNTWAYFAQRTLTLSFWVKSPKSGIHCVSLRNSGNDRSYVAEYSVNSANTWEKKTVTITASPSAGTWAYDTGVGVYLGFALLCGSTFQTTAGTWNTGNFIGTSNQVNVVDSNTNNFLIAQVQLEVGSIATDFALVPFLDEYQRCQRYYCKTFPYATAPATGAGVTGALYANDQVGDSKEWRFPVTMRAAPTVTTYNPVSANNNWRDTTNNADRGAPTQLSISENNFAVSSAGIASTNNFVHIDASAEL